MSDIGTAAFTPTQMNSLFGMALERGDRGDMDKVGSVAGLYLQRRLLENGNFRKVLPPETITPRDCRPSLTDDSLSYYDEIAPDGEAYSISFRGTSDATYVRAKRYEIKFFTITTDKFTKDESELMAYKLPLLKILEQQALKWIQEVEDEKAWDAVHAALFFSTRRRYNDLVASGELATTADLTTMDEFVAYLLTKVKTNTFPIAESALDRADGYYSNVVFSDESRFSRTVLEALLNIAVHREQQMSVFVVHQATFNNILTWAESEAGLQVTSEIVKGGWKAANVMGLRFVTTQRKNRNIIRPGVIYGFPDANFLGRFLLLNQTQFWINKNARLIEMEAWEQIAVGFGNIHGIGALVMNGATIRLRVNSTSDGAGFAVLTNDFAVTPPVPA